MVDGYCPNQNTANRFSKICSDLYSSVPDRDLNDVFAGKTILLRKATMRVTLHRPLVIACQKPWKEVLSRVSAQTKEMKPRASAVAFLNMARIASSCCFVGPSVQCYSVVLATLFVVYVIKPIPKNALNSTADSSNYRAISLNSIMSEIIDYIIIPLIESIFPMCIKNQPHYVHS